MGEEEKEEEEEQEGEGEEKRHSDTIGEIDGSLFQIQYGSRELRDAWHNIHWGLPSSSPSLFFSRIGGIEGGLGIGVLA
jgi:hypothetical protein